MPGSASAGPGRGGVTCGWGGDSPCPRAGGLAVRDFPGEAVEPGRDNAAERAVMGRAVLHVRGSVWDTT